MISSLMVLNVTLVVVEGSYCDVVGEIEGEDGVTISQTVRER